MADNDITVLIAGNLHHHAAEKLAARFRTIRIERGDASLVSGDDRAAVRGMAVQAGVNAGFIDAFPVWRSSRASVSATITSMRRMRRRGASS